MRTARLLVPLLAGVVLSGCGARSKSGAPVVDLRGRGSTFVQPIMKFWTERYADRTDDAVWVDYQGIGSGGGVNAVTNREADFGCSDAPMNAKQLAAARARRGEVVQVPVVMGAVVPVYNVPGVTRPLAFTGPLLADIFLGKVTHWNDAKLTALNPGVPLPDLKIQPVFRDDPSGTTFIFTDYLAKVSPPFRRAVGRPSNEPTWPTGVGTRQPKNDGVAGHVGRSAGAIGYVELTYALDTKARYGTVRNKAGRDILADLDGITAAAAATPGVKQTAEPYSLSPLTFSLTDAGGEKSYPIAGMSFALLYKKQTGEKGKAVVAFLKWVTSEGGQEMAARRNFAPLPAALRTRIAAALDEVEFTE